MAESRGNTKVVAYQNDSLLLPGLCFLRMLQAIHIWDQEKIKKLVDLGHIYFWLINQSTPFKNKGWKRNEQILYG